MTEHVKQSPSLSSGSCRHGAMVSTFSVGSMGNPPSAFLICRARQDDDYSRNGIHLRYPEIAERAAYDCSDCMSLQTSAVQSRYSYLIVYCCFSFRIKTLERGSEKYSL